MKKLITLCLFMVMACMVKAQTHISTGKWACSLVPRSLDSEKYRCPACAKLDEQKRRDKIDEDKRIADAVRVKAEADKKAQEIARRKEQAERDEKNKVTEVYITMPSGSASSGNSISGSGNNGSASPGTVAETSSDNISPSTSTTDNVSTSSGEATIYNNIFLAEKARKYNEEKAVQEVVTGVFNLFAPTPEKLESERKQREYAQRAATKDFELGQKLINDNVTEALNGDSLAIVNTYHGYLKTRSREDALQFVTKIHEKYRNRSTSSIIRSIYKIEEDRYNSEISLYQFDKRTNRAYVYMVLGGAIATAPLLYKNQLISKYGEDAGMASYIVAGAGGISILAAVIAKLTIPPLSSKTRYKEAVEGLKTIKAKNIQASVFPLYNYFDKLPMLGLNIKF